MANQSIVIIGAGIAGLSAGCYGQMNGYRTQIFEMHDKPGGLCTSWKRKAYTFDGCIRWLVGSKPGSSFNRIWQELGAMQGRRMVDHEEFIRVEGEGGRVFILYTDLDRLERHMKELAPADVGVIEEFCNNARRFSRLGEAMGAPEPSSGLLASIKAAIKMLPLIGPMRKYSKTSVHDFAARFSDPLLHHAFDTVFGVYDFPVLLLMTTLGWMHNRDAGYPIGGSLAFARAIERRYLDLGGEIHYRSRVEKILVENDRAVGVRLADGTEHQADVVISAADGRATTFDMLDGKYLSQRIRGYYDELPIFQPIVQVSLGIARDLSDEPPSVSFPLTEPITVAGEVHHRIGMRHFCYDPTLAPEGKSVVVVSFPSNHAYWAELHQERERYDAEKQQIAIGVIERLEQRIPGIKGQVEAVDVATPITTERYTGNWQGSIEGWLPTTQTAGLMVRGMEKTVPGLQNFHMVGQWVEFGGGLPPAAQSGRNVIRAICKQDRRTFQTQVP